MAVGRLARLPGQLPGHGDLHQHRHRPRLGRAPRVALGGRGPFRRFKDTLAGWPDEEDRWYGWSEERRLGRAREWLANAGYTAG